MTSFTDLFTQCGLKVDDSIIGDLENDFKKLLELFTDWNSKINLSAIRDPEEIYKKHFIDSLLATKHINWEEKNILDLGTGGGFPSLPLGIWNKHTGNKSRILALDSVAKKLKAVQAMADELDISVQTIHTRAEELGQDRNFREKFDVVATRAVAKWPTLLELTLPFLKLGGRLIAYQGPAVHEDLMAYKNLERQLGGKIVQIVKEDLFDSHRSFVIIKKVKPTPKKYPRANGIPKKEPLGSS